MTRTAYCVRSREISIIRFNRNQVDEGLDIISNEYFTIHTYLS